MKRRIILTTAVLGALVALVWWLPRQFPAPPPLAATVETMSPGVIVGLEVPVHTPRGQSVLRAAYAEQVGEDELKVYGGFVYVTPDRRIEGEEAIIHLPTGRVRGMKQIRIWEK